jgi:hypothetical protein
LIRPSTRVSVVPLACLFLAGCAAVPMTYEDWKEEQDARKRYADAGVPYKTREQLQDEAAEMRRVAQDTKFAPRK